MSDTQVNKPTGLDKALAVIACAMYIAVNGVMLHASWNMLAVANTLINLTGIAGIVIIFAMQFVFLPSLIKHVSKSFGINEQS